MLAALLLLQLKCVHGKKIDQQSEKDIGRRFTKVKTASSGENRENLKTHLLVSSQKNDLEGKTFLIGISSMVW